MSAHTRKRDLNAALSRSIRRIVRAEQQVCGRIERKLEASRRPSPDARRALRHLQTELWDSAEQLSGLALGATTGPSGFHGQVSTELIDQAGNLLSAAHHPDLVSASRSITSAVTRIANPILTAAERMSRQESEMNTNPLGPTLKTLPSPEWLPSDNDAIANDILSSSTPEFS
jgi:hypothetical protein